MKNSNSSLLIHCSRLDDFFLSSRLLRCVYIGPLRAQAGENGDAARRDADCESNLDTPCVRADNTF